MADSTSQLNASIDTTSTRQAQQEHEPPSMEESLADYTPPPAVSPIHALRHPASAALSDARAVGLPLTQSSSDSHTPLQEPFSSEAASRLGQPARSWHEDPFLSQRVRSLVSSPLASPSHKDTSDLLSVPSAASSSLNFHKQYQRAMQAQQEQQQQQQQHQHQQPEVCTATEEEARTQPRQQVDTERHSARTKKSGFLQLGLGKYKADLDEVDRYAKLYQDAQRIAEKKEQRARVLQEARLKEEDEHCTFRPKTLASPRRTTSAAVSSRRGTPDTKAHDDRSNGASPAKAPTTSPHGDGTTPRAPQDADVCSDKDAFTRLYTEALERNRRLERRRVHEAKETEHAQRQHCPFQPSLSPWREGAAAPAAGDTCGSNGERRRKEGSASVQPPSYASFDDFLQAQRERESRRKAKLAAAAKKLEAEAAPGLLRTVPASTTREKLAVHLVKDKGYVDPIRGWQERYAAYMSRKAADTPSGRSNAAGTPWAARSRSRAPSARLSSGGTTNGKKRSSSSRTSTGAGEGVFDRLYKESASRAAMKRLLELMEQEHTSQSYFKPNQSLDRWYDDATETEQRTQGTAPHRNQREEKRLPHYNGKDDNEVDSALASSDTEDAAGHLSDAAGEAHAVFQPTPNVFDGVHVPSSSRHVSPRHANGSIDSRAARASIFDELYAEREERRRRREMARLAAEDEDEVYSFHPHINPRSQELIVERAQAIARGERPARVARQKPTAEPKTGTGSNPRMRHSPRSANSRDGGDAEAFQRRVELFEERRRARIAAARMKEGENELRDCTFRPALSAVSRAITAASPSAAGPQATTATEGASLSVSPIGRLAPPSQPSLPQASATETTSADLVALTAGRGYAQAMETPEVKRALWSGTAAYPLRSTTNSPRQQRSGQTTRGEPYAQPDSVPHTPRSSKGTPDGSTTGRVKPPSQNGGSARSRAASATPPRVHVEDPTPASPTPLSKLLPASAVHATVPPEENQPHKKMPTARAMSIDLASPPGSARGSDGEERRPATYFRPGLAYCQKEEEEYEMAEAAGRELQRKRRTPAARSDELSDPLTEDSRRSWRKRVVPKQPMTSQTSPYPSPQEQNKPEGQHSSTPQERPPLSPQRTIDYGLAGVRGNDRATSSELESLEQELRGVMKEWSERLQSL